MNTFCLILIVILHYIIMNIAPFMVITNCVLNIFNVVNNSKLYYLIR